MNHEIPKPLRNALTRQAGGEVHPSPDVLTSFMERTLPPVENEVLTHHLAQCADCREIVFLASEAVKDAERHEEELAAAASVRLVAAVPARADSPTLPNAWTSASRHALTNRMRWAMFASVAAVLLVSSGVILQYWPNRHAYNPPVAMSNPPMPANQDAQRSAPTADPQAIAAKPAIKEQLATAAPRGVIAPRHVTAPVTGDRADESTPAAKVDSPPPASSVPASSGAVVGGMENALAPAVRPQSSFAENEAGQLLQLQQGAPVTFGKAKMGNALREPRPQWRISTEGHLERSTVPNQWARVLDDQPITFRVVSGLANDVWAGGNNGALFHSADRGAHWNQVSLAANSTPETGAIVSIRFADSQHGVVSSDNGNRWVTTDGGVTWRTQ